MSSTEHVTAPPAASTARPILQIRNLEAGYTKQVQILHGVDLSVSAGQSIALVGPNGAGKSTVLKAVMGLLSVRSGEVLVGGVDQIEATTETMVRNGVGYVPQTENVFLPLSVGDNLDVGAFLERKHLKRRKGEVLDLFPDLVAKLGFPAGTLSGGQRQMVAMARALMLEPEVLLLDEPTAGLSPLLMNRVFDQVELIRSTGVAVLLVEQNATRALETCQLGVALVNGKIAISGPGQQLVDEVDFAELYFGHGEPTDESTPS